MRYRNRTETLWRWEHSNGFAGTDFDRRGRCERHEATLTALEEYNLANEVVVTRDGQEALDYLYCRGQYSASSSDNPAVLLLDLKLPKVDGLEVLHQIKSDDRLKIIPVVVLTSSREERDMMRTTSSG